MLPKTVCFSHTDKKNCIQKQKKKAFSPFLFTLFCLSPRFLWTHLSIQGKQKNIKKLSKTESFFCITKIKCILLNAFAVRFYN